MIESGGQRILLRCYSSPETSSILTSATSLDTLLTIQTLTQHRVARFARSLPVNLCAFVMEKLPWSAIGDLALGHASVTSPTQTMKSTFVTSSANQYDEGYGHALRFSPSSAGGLT